MLTSFIQKHGAVLGLSLRLLLGLLFIYASFDKILNPGLFAKAIYNYRMLPLPLLHLAAIVLPWLELFTGLALIVNKYPRTANLLIGAMLVVFTLGIISAMARGLDFNCGCFDLSEQDSNLGARKIVENSLLILSVILLHLTMQIRSRKAIPS